MQQTNEYTAEIISSKSSILSSNSTLVVSRSAISSSSIVTSSFRSEGRIAQQKYQNIITMTDMQKFGILKSKFKGRSHRVKAKANFFDVVA